MKIKLLLSVFLTFIVFTFACDENESIVNPNNENIPTINIGILHNVILEKLISRNNGMNTSINQVALQTQNYFNEKYSSNISFCDKFVADLDNSITIYLNSKGRIVIDSLLSNALSLSIINEEDYSKLSEFSNFINENPDTNVVNSFCEMLPDDLSQKARNLIFYSATIYKASLSYWSGKDAPKSIVIIDAAGALLGSLGYLIDNYDDWSWTGLGVHALLGGVAASFFGWYEG